MRHSLLLLLGLVGCAKSGGPQAAAESESASPAATESKATATKPTEDRFDGDWGGTLAIGGASLRLVLHVRGQAATLDSLDQRVEGIPASRVHRDGDDLTVEFDAVKGVFQGTREGPDLAGTWTQMGQSAPLKLTRDLAPVRRARRQDPNEPLPYPTESVRVPVGEHSLACTLALPDDSGGPWPSVVLLTGSGPQDRDESLLDHRPFLVLSDDLARHGIASLRCDDRGVGESTGSFAGATSADFAVDARAAATWLKARPESASVGFIGHSEGGLVAPMAADSADFLVLLAPPAVRGDALYLRQIEDISRASGIPDDTLVELMAVHREAVGQSARGGVITQARMADLRKRLVDAGMPRATAESQIREVFGPWFRYFLAYDPAPALKALELPTLALWGGTDLQVHPLINQAAFAKATEGQAHAEGRVLPDLNHLFQGSKTGLPSEYAATEETLNPALLEAVRSWILGLEG